MGKPESKPIQNAAAVNNVTEVLPETHSTIDIIELALIASAIGVALCWYWHKRFQKGVVKTLRRESENVARIQQV